MEKNRREAKNVSIYEYDQEKHIRQEREEAWEAGREAGEKAGVRMGEENKLMELIRKKLAKGKSLQRANLSLRLRKLWRKRKILSKGL